MEYGWKTFNSFKNLFAIFPLTFMQSPLQMAVGSYDKYLCVAKMKLLKTFG